MGKEKIVAPGIIKSTRKIINVGTSKGVTLPKQWLDIQKWLGKEVSEMVSIANSVVILVRPGDEKKAIKIIKQFEQQQNASSGKDENPEETLGTQQTGDT